MLASSGSNGDVELWSIIEGRPIATLRGHTRGINGLAFSPDGSLLASAAVDNSVRLWDTATGDEQPGGPFAIDTDVTDVRFVSDGAVLVGWGATVAALWDVADGTLLGRTEQPVFGAVGVPSDASSLMTSSEGVVRTWDVASGELIDASLYGNPPGSLAPDGSVFAMVDDMGAVTLTSPVDGTVVGTLDTSLSAEAATLRFSPDNSTLLVADDTVGTLTLWSVDEGTSVELVDHAGAGTVGGGPGFGWAEFSADGSTVVTATAEDDDGVHLASVWDVATGELRFNLDADVWGAEVSADGSVIATNSGAYSASLWDGATGEPLFGAAEPAKSMWAISASPDGSAVATGSDDAVARIYDASTGEVLHRLVGHEDWINSIAYSPDGLRIATAGQDGTVGLWDSTTGEQIALIEAHDGRVNRVVFDPSGSTFAAVGYDGLVTLWDPTDGASTGQLAHDDAVSDAVFTGDGATLVTLTTTTVTWWDVATATATSTIDFTDTEVAPDFYGRRVAVSPDGATVAVGGDGDIVLIDADGGDLRRVLGHVSDVSMLRFGADGTVLASASEDGTAAVWNVATATRLATLPRHHDAVWDLVFVDGDTRVVTVGGDGQVLVSDAASGEVIASAASDVGGGIYAAVALPEADAVVTAGWNVTRWELP